MPQSVALSKDSFFRIISKAAPLFGGFALRRK